MSTDIGSDSIEYLYIELYNAGVALAQNRSFQEAASYFEKAYELLPENMLCDNLLYCYTNAGALLFDAGKYSDAILWLEKAYKLHNQSNDSKNNLLTAYSAAGRHYFDRHQYHMSMPYYEGAYKLASTDIACRNSYLAVLRLCGVEMVFSGQYNVAKDLFEKAVNILSTIPQVCLASDVAEPGAELFKQITATDYGIMLCLNSIQNTISAGALGVAEQHLNRVDDCYQGASRNLLYNILRAECNSCNNRWSHAVKYLEKADRMTLKQPLASLMLGNLYVKMGLLSRAAPYLLRAHRLTSMRGKEDIIVYGDSHAVHFFGRVPRCKIVHHGPITMFRIARDNAEIIDINSDRLAHSSAVVYVFGEIDLRVHIPKRVVNESGFQSIIGVLCQNYVKAISNKMLMHSDIAHAICSIAPPSIYTNYNNPTNGYPVPIATQYANNLLKELCAEAGIKYVNTYKYIADTNGYLIRELSDGNIHSDTCNNEIFEYELEAAIGPYKSIC